MVHVSLMKPNCACDTGILFARGRGRPAAGCGAESGSRLPQSKGFALRCWWTMMFLWLVVLPTHAQWRLVSESEKLDLGHGAWQTKKQAKGPADMELTLVFFDAKTTRTEFVAQTAPERRQARTLKELAEASSAIAVCNGGYFTREFGPAGLEIAGGVRTGKWQSGLTFGGVLFVRQGRLALIPDSKYQEDPAITDLVQCCPMLVQEGVVLRGIGGGDHVARTFVATDGADGWLIGFCSRATLPDLADALATPGVLHEFRVQTALNLDGGPSSGLWWKPQTREAGSVSPTTRVRNVIMILPK